MLKLFPNPKSIIYEEGVLEFKPNFFVEFSHEPDEEYNFGVKKLVEYIKTYTNSELSAKKGEDTTVISFMFDESLQKEEYKIEVYDEDIVIKNSGYVSAFRAISTLKQIFKQCKTEIPQLSISDKPDIENRGIMLDVSRGKVPKIEELKKLIDIISDLKYNQFQLYIDDIVFAYPSFKEYWKDSEPLLPEEIKDLSSYCKERCIELVPNQNCFGHMSKWLANPELKHLAICEDGFTLADGIKRPPTTLNPLDPETYEFVGKIFADIMPCYESDYINVGCDETNEIGMGKTEQAVKETSRENVYSEFLLKIRELAQKHNKHMMFWDDRLILHPEYIKKLPKDIIPLDWGYEPHSTMVESRTKLLAEEGFEFYVCPGTSSWHSFLGRSTTMVANQLRYAVYGKRYNALGYLLTDWGDGGNSQFPVISLIPYIFGAGVSWNCDDNADVSFSLEYMDEYIWGGKYDGLAKLIYAAGNYYKHEKVRINNGTVIGKSTVSGLLDPTLWKNDDYDSMLKMCNYVSDIKEKILNVVGNDNNEILIKELILNIDMTIIFGKAIAAIMDKERAAKENINTQELITSIEELMSRFEKLWLTKNRKRGLHRFIGSMTNSIRTLKNL